jgi:hypothetical protein
MAAKTRIIRLSWENDVNFKMDSKLDDGDYITVIDVDENGHLNKLWESGIADVCKKYFETELGIIGQEMKA